MSTLHCPLCGLRFRYASELDEHAREDHSPPPRLSYRPEHVPPPREQEQDEPRHPDHEPVLHLPW